MIKWVNSILIDKLWLKGSFSFYFAFSIMIILPIYHWYLPPFMVLWGILWLIEFRFRTKDIHNITSHRKLLFIIFIIFFVWQIFGMLYSDYPKEGWRNIILRLSLFLFPLVLISPGDMIKRNITKLFRLFAFSTLLYLIFCFGYALYRSVNFQHGILTFNPHPPVHVWLSYFYASELAIFQHPSYLSMYVLLSVFIAFELFFDSSVSRSQRVFWFVASIILLISIYFLSSRAEILATIITVPVYVILKVRNRKENRYIGIGLLVGILILLPILLTNPRVKKYLKFKSGKEFTDLTLKEGRVTIWNSVNSIIKQNFIFGVGTGDIQEELNKEYIKSGNPKLAEGNYNTHNQYIEVMIENGLIGLILFLSAFGMMFYIAFSEKNHLYIIFLIIVFISFLFETMLNRLGGVSFFALFSFLLLHINKDVKNLSPL